MLQSNKAANATNQSEIAKKFSFSGTLNSLGKIDRLPACRFRWNTNEEVFTILTSLEEHKKWVANEVKIRPPNGSQLLYDRNNLNTRSYHNDKYYWKTRKNSKSSARVDHSSLRIRGIECIYCSYVHSALVPTFHRRCYWLLENPDIVLVHYLNIPDKATTFDNLVASLLPYKKLTDQELLFQLQPILTAGEDEGSMVWYNMVHPIDVTKLIAAVKDCKEPKTKGRTKQKKASRSTKQTSSSTLCKLTESTTKGSQTLDKCSNCNRYYNGSNSTASDSSRTNVAVTINRTISSATRHTPTCENTCDTHINFTSETTKCTTTPVSTSSPMRDLEKQKLSTSSLVQHSTYTVNPESYQPDLLHPFFLCQDFVNRGAYSIVSENNNHIPSNSHHGYSKTSQENHCMSENGPVMLDYDGINLVQSSESENDFSKDFDISLFENDLLSYLPDYLPGVADLQTHLPNSFEVMSSIPSMTLDQNFNVEPLVSHNNRTSSEIDVPSHSRYGNYVKQTNLSAGTASTIVRRLCSPTNMISTDCHTFSGLTPSLLQSREATIDDELTGHQCPSKDHPSFDEGNHVLQINIDQPDVVRCQNGVSNSDAKSFVAHSGTSSRSIPTISVSSIDPIKDALSVTQSNPGLQSAQDLCTDFITEFSPEWSYCDGKTKVLILGEWSHTNGLYSSLFDGCSVPAALIQPGVLRCFCPPHDPGMVSLQVAWNGFIISNACVFEYKTREKSSTSMADWLGASNSDLKKLILERLERLESLLGVSFMCENTEGGPGTFEGEAEAIEDRLVNICEALLAKMKTCNFPTDIESRPKGVTLLHLAAGLGYTKLIRLLQDHARAEQLQRTEDQASEEGVTESTDGSTEWSPRTKDSFGCIPLMWACWRGHHDAAMTLLAWQPSSYSDCDHGGRSAKEIALEMGHGALMNAMEEYMHSEDMYSLVMESSPQSPSSSCAYLSVSSSDQAPQSPMSTLSADSLTWQKVEGVSEPSADFEMASVITEERPSTLGKILVEIRTLIQEAEERARSPLQTPSNSAPFALSFTGLSDLAFDDRTSDNVRPADPELCARTSNYDTLPIESSPVRSPSTHSPGSPAIRGSPQSTGTDTSEFEEFLSKPRQFLERDFSELTLTDDEQQELLQAAKVIQNAYRQFKIRKKQHVDELRAAVLIQSYYRRYKQFALYKRITKAAVLIQNSYRAHKEHEQFKRSRHAAAVIQTYFRHYRKRKQRHAEEETPGKRLERKYRKPSYGK